jgi:type IV secretory pathway TrbF-like protein
VASLHKPTTYAPLALNNPFEARDRRYGELLLNERKEKNLYRIIALVCLGFTGLSIVGLFYGVSLQKNIPYLVNVMPTGESQYLGEVRRNGSLEIPEAAVQFQVRTFLTYLRSIPGDREMLYRDITLCYSMVTAECEKKMTRELTGDSPFKASRDGIKRTLQIESVLKLTNGTYQLDWTESTSSGGQTSRSRLRGLFTVKLLAPTDKNRQANPLGIYIDNYDITAL